MCPPGGCGLLQLADSHCPPADCSHHFRSKCQQAHGSPPLFFLLFCDLLLALLRLHILALAQCLLASVRELGAQEFEALFSHVAMGSCSGLLSSLSTCSLGPADLFPYSFLFPQPQSLITSFLNFDNIQLPGLLLYHPTVFPCESLGTTCCISGWPFPSPVITFL